MSWLVRPGNIAGAGLVLISGTAIERLWFDAQAARRARASAGYLSAPVIAPALDRWPGLGQPLLR